MNIFKLFIPKEKAQVVEVLESWTVSWDIKTGWSGATERQSKVFIEEAHAKEFQKQLRESAKFVGCWINTDLIRN